MVKDLVHEGVIAAGEVGIYGGAVSAAFAEPVGDEDVAMILKLGGVAVGRVWQWRETGRWHAQSAFTGKCRSTQSIRDAARHLLQECQARHN